MSKLKQSIGISIQDKKYNYLQLYHEVTNEYFFKKPANGIGVVRLARLKPIIRDVIDQNYILSLLYMGNLIIEVSKQLYDIKIEEYKRIGTHKECFICMKKNRSYTSEEHIIPTGLNDKYILPIGYVCDQCNHGVCQEMDNVFQEFPMIKYILAVHEKFNYRKGVFRETNFQNIVYKNIGPNMVEIHDHSTKNRISEFPVDKNGLIQLELKIVGKRLTKKLRKQFVRSLLKIALELIAYDKGHLEVLQEKYNKVREAVIGKVEYCVEIQLSNGLVEHSKGKEIAWIENDGVHRFLILMYGSIVQYSFNLENTPIERVEIPSSGKFDWV